LFWYTAQIIEFNGVATRSFHELLAAIKTVAAAGRQSWTALDALNRQVAELQAEAERLEKRLRARREEIQTIVKTELLPEILARQMVEDRLEDATRRLEGLAQAADAETGARNELASRVDAEVATREELTRRVDTAIAAHAALAEALGAETEAREELASRVDVEVATREGLARRVETQIAAQAALAEALRAETEAREEPASRVDAEVAAREGLAQSLGAETGAREELGRRVDAEVAAREGLAQSLGAETGAREELGRHVDAEIAAHAALAQAFGAEVGAREELVRRFAAEVTAREGLAQAFSAEVGAREELARHVDAEVAARAALVQGLNAEMGAREELARRVDAEIATREGLAQALAAETGIREHLGRCIDAEIAAREALANHVIAVSNHAGTVAADLRQSDIRLLQLRAEVISQNRRVSMLLEEARKRLPAPFDDKQLVAITDEEKHSLDAVYVSFEDQFRGTRAEIKDRSRVYLPFLQERKIGTKRMPILDVGCGRGEWLELLLENELEARGIDINRVLLAYCREAGLNVAEADILDHLKNLPDRSLGAVTGFHIIEHLPFHILVRVFDETVRVLKPGGIAIFETPNPQNVLVGSHNFYLDFTHRNPLPSLATQFFLEARGLCDVQVLNLHPYPEAAKLRDDGTELARRFNEYFYGPQDYAVIGRKA
jgi:SAM-dependent methyltransferase/cell division protein FtsB